MPAPLAADPCVLLLVFTLSSQCCVCPVIGGALKPTTIRGTWCHSACMQWIPEVGVAWGWVVVSAARF